MSATAMLRLPRFWRGLSRPADSSAAIMSWMRDLSCIWRSKHAVLWRKSDHILPPGAIRAVFSSAGSCQKAAQKGGMGALLPGNLQETGPFRIGVATGQPLVGGSCFQFSGDQILQSGFLWDWGRGWRLGIAGLYPLPYPSCLLGVVMVHGGRPFHIVFVTIYAGARICETFPEILFSFSFKCAIIKVPYKMEE